MADLLQGENSGVKTDVRITDYKVMGESTIVYQVVEEDGDWTKYKPTDEWQRRFVNGALGYDTNSCTNFSCMNSVELQVERMLSAGEIPDATIEEMHSLGLYDDQGNVNFNDWFNAIMSGTTWQSGNTLYNPWDAIRAYGLLAQGMGPKPNDFTTYQGWFTTKPSAGQIEFAKKVLDIFDFNYEWVVIGQLNQWDTISYHLKQAPLHVLVPTGSTWNDKNVKNPTPTWQGVNHAVTLVAQKQGVSHTILDHYNPFLKNLEWNYYIPYVLKGVVTLKKSPATPVKPSHVFSTALRYGMKPSEEIHHLQEALQYLGYMKVGLFGWYLDATRAAVGKFQTDHGIKDPDGQGMNFGPQTRAAMNKVLST